MSRMGYVLWLGLGFGLYALNLHSAWYWATSESHVLLRLLMIAVCCACARMLADSTLDPFVNAVRAAHKSKGGGDPEPDR